MTTTAMLVLGVIVTTTTASGAVLIGLDEAADPVQSRVDDLTEFEKNLVGRDDSHG